MLSAEEGASESAEAINEQSTSNQDRRGLEAIVAANLHMRSRIISVNLSRSQHAIGTQSESSSDKCLIVISQRCRSPRTASDSSSSCLHMKREAITMQSRGCHRCAISHPSLSSDKCLIVISQRCRSPRTASDSSSSCLHMKREAITMQSRGCHRCAISHPSLSSDKCLIVISQRCRSPRTASDSSSSCLHMKREAITMQSRGCHRCAISHPSLSSDKCLIVISQRCRSPRTASDSSSSCLHMKRPILGDYSPPGHQRPSEAIRGHQRPSAAISGH